jgi:prepilin-type N-terminal cleavage/methylation domain-containing protein
MLERDSVAMTSTRQPIKKSQLQGFSLIEVMVSLTLLVIGLMAILAMQMSAVEANLNNMAFLEAISLRDEIAEQVQTSRADTVFDENGGFQREALESVLPADALGDLDGQYQFSGLSDTTMLLDPEDPDRIAGFDDDNIRIWRQETRHLSYNEGDPIVRDYAVRLAIDEDFADTHGLAQETVVRCLVTVFWVEDGEVRSTDSQFFITRR